MFIWERDNWPDFTFDLERLLPLVSDAAHATGRLLGRMEELGFDIRGEAHLRTLTEDVLKTSEIEGEFLEPRSVRSSLARRLGINIGGLVSADRIVDGVVEMMLDATERFEKPLTRRRLYAWHGALFPAGRSGLYEIPVARWRDDQDGPMEVVSGPIGRQRVHFRAPPAERVDSEIGRFLEWYEGSTPMHPLLAAGLAHFWLVTVHPFADGNGRIARAVADMMLARADGSPQRFYSMAAQIRRERDDYYTTLERSQRGGLDISDWLAWFLGCLQRAVANADDLLVSVIAKARFWRKFSTTPMNARQVKVLNRLLDGFEGKLTSSKWAKLAKCSQDTAHRDIVGLIEAGALQKDPGGGRSTSYSLIAAT